MIRATASRAVTRGERSISRLWAAPHYLEASSRHGPTISAPLSRPHCHGPTETAPLKPPDPQRPTLNRARLKLAWGPCWGQAAPSLDRMRIPAQAQAEP